MDEAKEVVEPLNTKEEKATTETTTQNTKETNDDEVRNRPLLFPSC